MNVAAVTGRLPADPARRETTKGVAATFRVASDSSPRIWIDVECWGHLAGTVAAHLTARQHVAVTGSVAHSQWTDRHGTRVERWFIRATHGAFLDRPDGRRPDGHDEALGRHALRADRPASS